MYYPDETEFKALSKKGNLIPVWREILADLETPVSAFIKLGKGKCSYLLESVERGEQLGRYSFLGSDPVLVFKSKGERIEIIRQGKSEIRRVEKDPLDALKKIMAGYKTVNSAKLPRFSGGAVGYVGYDMVRFWEEIPQKNRDDLNLPDSLFMLSHTLVIFDHLNHKIKVVSYALLDGKESPQIVYQKAKREIDGVIKKLRRPSPSLLHGERKEKKKEIANEKIESDFTSHIF